MTFKHTVTATACAAAVLATSGAALAATTASTTAPAPNHSAGRGTIVSTTRLPQLSAGEIKSYLKESGFDASQVRYGVDAYRIVYRT
ncbi:MAG TPA: hypothetical protein VGL21_08105, partial [Jatrophihabitantaceae bacterium]